ncbi:MAG: hypothetical protein HY721_30265 [Planctomycetes bacterium]|nr:hypothetical protein [Planctomycetota bacterium]
MSVRDASEALASLEGGASILDVKEPREGPLGDAGEDARCAVVAAATAWREPSVLVTAALGELRDRRDAGSSGGIGSFGSIGSIGSFAPTPGVALYKLGLSGLAGPGWEALLDRWSERLAAGGAGLVAAAYADARRAGSPDPRDVLEHAARRGLPYLLLDTFAKGEGRLLDWLGPDDLRALIAAAREARVGVALAGSLEAEDLDVLLPLGPDVIAVRGAACRGGRRDAPVERERVARLAAQVTARVTAQVTAQVAA